ncbi:MAG: peptidylprolyl isomerase, partial [Pirellulales bacterium]|nr:peptidylprolyl isomerase [Pirellulales bacterium]
MFFRLPGVVVLVSLLASTTAAQTVRFDTNVGTFDVELNPTGNANLQGHVDNMLAYVNARRYNGVVINRAVDGDNNDPSDDFVLQLGGFLAASLSLPSSFNAFPSVQRFDQVVVDTTGDNVIDFDTDVFDNTRGTVTLALSSMRTTTFSNDPGTPTVNSGTNSFFVNLGDNTGLDPGVTQTIFHQTDTDPVTGLPLQANIVTGGFVPFAFIRDMATVDLIMSLEQT